MRPYLMKTCKRKIKLMKRRTFVKRETGKRLEYIKSVIA